MSTALPCLNIYFTFKYNHIIIDQGKHNLTAHFNIKESCILFTQYLCFLYSFHNIQQLFA
jgi:hypothetical protein